MLLGRPGWGAVHFEQRERHALAHVSRRRSSQHINTHLSHEAEARGEVEPGPEGHVAEVRLKPPPRVEDDGGGAMLPSLGTRLPKHGSASVLRGSRLRCTGE